jgi:hypothetical protein
MLIAQCFVARAAGEAANQSPNLQSIINNESKITNQ